MLRSKKDVDKHVRDILAKIKNEKERQLRGYTIALQYFNIDEFEVARMYLSGFLAIKPKNPDAHRLLGQIYEGLKEFSKALQAYKTAYEISDTQKGLVLKICDLSIENTSDRSTLQYWLEEGEKLFPSNSVIIRLKESLVMSGGNLTRHQMEKFYLEEIKKNPLALTYHLRLVNLYLDWSKEKSEQIQECFNYICKIESRSPFPNSLEWYKLLAKVMEAYDKMKYKISQVFIELYLIILDRCVFLSMCCRQRDVESQNESLVMLKKFDSCLVKSKHILKSNSPFLHHMSAQFYYHAASNVFKTQSSGGRKSDPVMVGLLLCLAAMPRLDILNPKGVKDLKEISQDFARLFGAACCRVSQCSHILSNLAFINGKWDKFKEKMEELRSSNGTRQALGNLIFKTEKESSVSHFLVTDTFFNDCLLQRPSEERVRECDQELVLQCNEDLHCLLWLFSQPPYSGSSMIPSHEGSNELYQERPIGTLLLSADINRELPFTEITNGTLCHLDLVSFIEAAIWCRENEESRLDEIYFNPPQILPILSTNAQLEWWTSAQALTSSNTQLSSGNQGSVSHNRRHSDLQSGLRILRADSGATAQYGVLPTAIALHLARYFMHGASCNDFSHSEQLALHDRAKIYWLKVLNDISKPSSNNGLRRSLEGELFVVKNWNISSKESREMEEQAIFYQSSRLEYEGKMREAIDKLSSLKSPMASFQQSRLLREEASKLGSSNDERVREKYVGLLTQSRDALYLTLDRLKMPGVPQSHPLNLCLSQEMHKIEHLLAETLVQGQRDQETDSDSEHDHFQQKFDISNGRCPPGIARLGSSAILGSSGFGMMSSTPIRATSSNGKSHHRQEARPSPERLEAQVRNLTSLHENSLSCIREHIEWTQSKWNLMFETWQSLSKESRESICFYKRFAEEQVRELRDLVLQMQLDMKDLIRQNHLEMKDTIQHRHHELKAELQSLSGQIAELRISRPIERLEPVVDQTPHVEMDMTNSLGSVYNNYMNLYGPQGVNSPGLVGSAALFNPCQHPPFRPPATIDPSMMAPTSHAIYSSGQQYVAQPPPQQNIQTSNVKYSQPKVSASVAKTPSQHLQTRLLSNDVQPHSTAPHAFQIALPASNYAPVLQREISADSSLSFTTEALLSNIPAPLYSAITTMSSQDGRINNVLATSLGYSGSPVAPDSHLRTPGNSIMSSLPQTGDTPKSLQMGDHSLYGRNQSLDSSSGYYVEDECDPCPDFKPVIPLPEKVETCTGEEMEKVLFEERAKLFRYSDKEWKERGVGPVKILHNQAESKVRILMRRDQTHKICCNHLLIPSYSASQMQGNEKAWVWAAQDFADEKLQQESFCIRFKSVEIGQKFKNMFDSSKMLTKMQPQATANNQFLQSPAVKTAPIETPTFKPFGDAFKPANGSWNCSACYLNNRPDAKSCASCSTPGPNVEVETQTSSNEIKDISKLQFNFGFSPMASSIGGVSSVSTPPKTASLFSGLKFSSDVKLKSVLGTDVGSVDSSRGPDGLLKTPESKVVPNMQIDPLSTSTPQQGNQSIYGKNQSFDTSGSYYVDDECDPCPDFKPVIPLPDKVETCTGEENEKVLFEERAKLFRYADKEWKERGVGPVKILENEANNTVRILMRRDQTHKICCNHLLLPDYQMTQLQGSEQAWVWVAKDFADEKLQQERFCIKFKTAEIGQRFKSTFDLSKVRTKISDPVLLVTTPTKLSSSAVLATTREISIPKPFGDEFKPAKGSWNCSGCYLNNKPDAKLCASCSTPGPNAENDAEKNLNKNTDMPKSLFNFGFASVASNVSSTSLVNTPPKPSLFSGFKFGSSTPPNTCTEIPIVQPLPSTLSMSSGASTEAIGKFSMSGFTFSSTPIIKNEGKEQNDKKKEETKISTSESRSSIFSNMTFSSMGGMKKEIDFKLPTSATSTGVLGEKDKANFLSFDSLKPQETSAKVDSSAFVRKPLLFGSGVDKSVTQDGSDISREEVEDFEPQVDFKPVIPLPALVEVLTGEEGHSTLFREHVELYRFDTDTKEWKERGVGDIKLLKNDSTSKVRLLMRRDQTHKVCANHFLTAGMIIKPLQGSDRQFIWTAMDFADEQSKKESFAVKFKDSKMAASFKKLFEESVENSTNLQMTEETNVQKSKEENKKNEPKSSESRSSSLFDKFKPAAGSWECEMCLVRNGAALTECLSCLTPKPGSTVVPKPEQKVEKGFSAPDFSFGTSSSPSPYRFGMPSSNISTSISQPSSTASITLASNLFGAPSMSTAGSTAFKFGTSTVASSSSFLFGVPTKTVTSSCSSAIPIKKDNPTTPDATSKDNKSSFAFGSPNKYEFKFSGVDATSPRSRDVSTCESEDGVLDEDNGDHLYFEPVIPLPDKVEVVTGEEDEECNYTHRCKLFRLANGEWKERGLGDIKILRHERTNNVRLLMRREVVHKICLNQRLDSSIDFRNKDDKTIYWAGCDFSEGTDGLKETFALRFKTAEILSEFLAAVKEARILQSQTAPLNLSVVSEASLVASSVEHPASKSDISFVEPDSTTVEDDLSIIYERHADAEKQELARKLHLPLNFFNYESSTSICPGCLGCPDREDKFQMTPIPKPKEDSICDEVSTSVTPVSPAAVQSPLAATLNVSGSKIFGTTSEPSKSTNLFGSTTPFKSSVGASPSLFGANTAATTTTFGAPSIFGVSSTPQASFSNSTAETKASLFSLVSGNDKPSIFGGSPVIGQASIFGGTSTVKGSIFGNVAGTENKPLTFGDSANVTKAPLFAICDISSISDNKPSIFGAASVNKPSIFGANSDNKQIIFGENADNKTLIFGGTSNTKQSVFGESSNNKQSIFGGSSDNKQSIFGGSSDNSLSFGGLNTPKSGLFSPQATDLSTPPKAKDAAAWKSKPLFESNKSITSPGTEDYDPESCGDVHFEPVVPMPELIKITTGEEDWAELFSKRAKTFKFDKELKQWKERGIGEFKIQHHPMLDKYRLLQRREQVHKLSCNHFISSQLSMERMESSEVAWCWHAMDYSNDSEGEQLQMAVKFKTAAIADEFKTVFDTCQKDITSREESAKKEFDAEAVSDVHEYDEEDCEEDYIDDSEPTILFKAECILAHAGGPSQPASLSVYYDDEAYGARIVASSNSEEILADHLIAIQSTLSTNSSELTASWTGVEEIDETKAEKVQFEAEFSDKADFDEFKRTFNEGKVYADKAVIDIQPYDFSQDDDTGSSDTLGG